MRRIFLVLIALSTMGMGGKRPDLPAPEPYQDRFKTIGDTMGAIYINDSATFAFSIFMGFAVGLCNYSPGHAAVTLSSPTWKNGSDTLREMLVFHELGHCLLGRSHDNARLSSGQPESLMNAVLFDEKTYLANRDQYLKELFTAETIREVSTGGQFDGCRFGK